MTSLARTLITGTAILMMPVTASADASTSGHALPVMQVSPGNGGPSTTSPNVQGLPVMMVGPQSGPGTTSPNMQGLPVMMLGGNDGPTASPNYQGLPVMTADPGGPNANPNLQGLPVMMVGPGNGGPTTSPNLTGLPVMQVSPQDGGQNTNPSVQGLPVMEVSPGDANTNPNTGGLPVMQIAPGDTNGLPVMSVTPPANNEAGSTDGSAGANGHVNESDIINKQINLDSVWTNTNATADNVNGDVNGSASAAANAFQAVTMNNTLVDNKQYASGAAVGADLNAQVTNINGSVNMGTTVACNTADVSTDPAYNVAHSQQECAVGDPSQATNVFAAQIQNDVNVQGSVAGNVYTEDTNAKYNYVNTKQLNQSSTNSTTNVQAYNVGGSVNVSSSAVGNTAQVVHY